MKAVTGVLVVAATLMAACGPMQEEHEIQQSAQALSVQDSKANDYTSQSGSCWVGIQCADGSWRSCSGTRGSCWSDDTGGGSVTCNGITYSCPPAPPPPTCVEDGHCEYACGFDPDCYCRFGRECWRNADCGLDGFCSYNACVCL